MCFDRFSPLERSFLDEENWFQSLRILEANLELVDEDFSLRLADAAGSCDDGGSAHLLSESAQVVSRAVADGVEAAAEEKLGKGGVLAGLAREARARYYESGDTQVLLASIDQFVEALMCDDDPMLFDQGRTLQGFGTTLIDLSNHLPDPAVNHVGCLALLASMTSHLTMITPYAEDVWVDRLRSLISGVRLHLKRADALPLEASEIDFYESVGRACDLADEALAGGASGFLGMLDAAFPLLSVALASVRVNVPLPRTRPPRDDQFQQAAEVWLQVVVHWIERYGSDCLRVMIAAPMLGPLVADQGEAAALSAGRRFEQPGLEEIFATASSERFRFEGALTPAHEALALVALAGLTGAVDPDGARDKVASAKRLLEEVEDAPPEAASQGDFFHSRRALSSLVAGVSAFVEDDADAVGRFRAVREALPVRLVDELVAAAEDALDNWSGEPGQPVPLTVGAAAQLVTCLHDPVSLLMAVGSDLGLPDGDRYRGILERLNVLLFGAPNFIGGTIRVDEGVARREGMAALLARFEAGPSDLEGSEQAALRDWLAEVYETGGLSFPNPNSESTFLVNMGWLHMRTVHEDTLRWVELARRHGLDEGALEDVATADVNAACHYLDILHAGGPWTVGVEDASGRLFGIIGALSHAVEAFRITTVGLGLTDPEDRFHVGASGYIGVRELIEKTLFEARDASLLTEYLLNARGMWFLLDLYEAAGGAEAPPPRVISWRKRSWVSQSLAVDQALGVDPESDAVAELAEVLSPGGMPQAMWFGSMLSPERETVASAVIVPPDAFAASFDEFPAAALDWEAMSALEVAAALGGSLPARIWRVADALVNRGERMTMFASPDPGLPPVAMGMWRHPGAGDATVLADAFDVVYCPTLAPRQGWAPWIAGNRPAAAEAFVVCDPLGDLPGARFVPELAREVRGNALNGVNPPADRATVLASIDACAQADGVFVYQGHSESGAIDRPDAACLLLEPVGSSPAVADPLRLGELLRGVRASPSGRMPRRAAFLSCDSGSSAAPYDATGLAMGALAAGSDAVISTLRPVADADAWGPIVDQIVDVLRAPRPWQAFGQWQRQAAEGLDSIESEGMRQAITSLTVFGGPYIPAAATVPSDG